MTTMHKRYPPDADFEDFFNVDNIDEVLATADVDRDAALGMLADAGVTGDDAEDALAWFGR